MRRKKAMGGASQKYKGKGGIRTNILVKWQNVFIFKKTRCRLTGYKVITNFPSANV